MEFLHGEDLGAWLDRESTAPIAAATDWVQQALAGLAFVHQHHVVHRDLKPDNLFLSRDPRGHTVVRLMDFGIAKVREREQQLTNPDMGKMGTLRYMSPEQLDSPDQVDHRADLFAMGAILYEVLVGRSPFDDDSDYHVMRRIAEGRYTAPGDTIPDVLAAIIGRALATSPDDRFDSAEAFSKALEEAAQAERYRRARRLLHAVESYGLPHRWWVPDDPDERWLRGQEQRLQGWLREHAPTTAAPLPSAETARRDKRALPGGATIELAALPSGTFQMGSPAGESGRHDDEAPQREVSLSALWMMVTPVTQAQWTALGEDNPSRFSDDPHHPVERVRWADAIRYANRLSAHVGLRAAYLYEGGVVRWDRTADGFRLPTEAEWEYACRAGSRGPAWWTDADASAWHAGNASGQTQPVGQKRANPWGLHDMNGNVYEWCFDRLGSYLTAGSVDPFGAESGEVRVFRGGSYRSEVGDLRSAFRNGREPDFCHESLGFRLVRGAPVSADE